MGTRFNQCEVILNNLEKAKKLFFVANRKSEGRIFGSKDPKYRNLIRE